MLECCHSQPFESKAPTRELPPLNWYHNVVCHNVFAALSTRHVPTSLPKTIAVHLGHIWRTCYLRPWEHDLSEANGMCSIRCSEESVGTRVLIAGTGSHVLQIYGVHVPLQLKHGKLHQ